MNEDFQKFVAHVGVSDTLIEQASKEEIAEVARVLALHVAHYRARYGDVSVEESLGMMRTETASDEQAKVRFRRCPAFTTVSGPPQAGLFG